MSFFNKTTICDLNCEKKILSSYHFFKSKENNTSLTDKELLSIVIPEIITYSPQQDRFEKYLVIMYYLSNRNHFKKISIGPFQMQINFLLEYSNVTNYDDLIQRLDEFSKIDKQYQILNNYVLNNSKLSLKELTNKYNSGRINGNYNFTKIKTNQSYYELSKNLISTINK